MLINDICTNQNLSKEKRYIKFSGTMRYERFGLFWFYGISTIVGYLMPNPF